LEGKRRDAFENNSCAGQGAVRTTEAFTRHTNRSGVRRMDSVQQFLRDEEGQDVVEYGLLIATIAIVVLIGVNYIGGAIQQWFMTLAQRITTNS